jgi:diguanylate cyclase (GGDEF)-like protein
MPFSFLSPERYLNLLRTQPPAKLIALTLILLGLCAYADYSSPPEIAFTVFYLIPIAIAAYFLTDRFAFVIIVTSAALWYGANLPEDHRLEEGGIHLWNAVTRLLIFLTVGGLVAAVRRSWQQQHELAHTDFLTSLPNRRHFSDLLETEIQRAGRSGRWLSVSYLDVDDFKMLNDYLGHATGDTLLREVALLIRKGLRDSDTAARIGGDEFAILFPDTDSATVSDLCRTLHESLTAHVRSRDWPVSFSIGVLTCPTPPADSRQLLHEVDEIMYKAKRAGKNRIHHEIYLPSASKHAS